MRQSLEHVSAGQTRFTVPGVACDARGVALGRFLVVLLPSVDRVVGVFRGIAERVSLDDLLPACRVARVRTAAGAHEFIVRLPANGSHVADSCAAVARLVGGLVFTGTSRHFVAYRDSMSPLGYDIESLFAGGEDYVLYGQDFVQSYSNAGDLDVAGLILGLALQPKRDDRPRDGEGVLLRVEKGLWRAVVAYLHRNGVACAVAGADTADAGRDANAPGRRDPFFLVKADGLPDRMLRLFRQLPGVEIYRMHGERAAVELGYEHPVVLESCLGLFAQHQLYLFAGGRNRLEVMGESPRFVSAGAVVDLGAAARPVGAVPLRSAEVSSVRVGLRLVPSEPVFRAAVGTRIRREDAARLKLLVCLLPPNVLEEYRICIAEADIYIYAAAGVDFIPLGELFWAAAPGVLIPVGHRVSPAVSGSLLLEHLDAGPEELFFWPRESEEILRFSGADFVPLGRAAVAELPIKSVRTLLSAEAVSEIEVSLVNEEVGLFPLWGFDDDKGR